MFLVELAQSHAFNLEHKLRVVVGAEMVYSGISELVQPFPLANYATKKPKQIKDHGSPRFRPGKVLAKTFDISLNIFCGYCLYSFIRDWNSPFATGSILPPYATLLLANKAVRGTSKALLKRYPNLSDNNRNRIIKVANACDMIFSAARIVIGAYFVLTNLPKAMLGDKDKNTLVSIFGKAINEFDTNDVRKKFLVLNHIDTTQFISGYASGLKQLSNQYDVKFAVISKPNDFSREICAGASAGNLEGIMLTVHGNENGIALNEEELRKASACFKKIKHAQFILNTCYGAALKHKSPAAMIARISGLKVVSNTGLSMWYPYFTSFTPLTARFVDPIRPWRNSTMTFGGNQTNISSTFANALQVIGQQVNALMMI